MIQAGRSGIVTTMPALGLVIVATATTLSGCGGETQGPLLAGGREVKAWINDLHDKSPQVRRQAVLKLGNVADSDPSVAEGLVEALGDADALVRRDAIMAAAKLKEPPAAIKERLEVMSRTDKDARSRELAGKAVIRLGGGE